MYTLLIDGSGPRMGLGICREGELQHLLRSPFEAYEELTDWLMQTLKHHSIASEAVKRLGVVTGPGSYTGLRSSLLLMRTWSQTRHLPIWGCAHWELALFDLRHVPQEILFVQAIKRSHYFVARGRYQAGHCLYSIEPQLVLQTDWDQEQSSQNACLVSPHSQDFPNALPLRDSISSLADWVAEQAPVAWHYIEPVYAKPATLATPRSLSENPTPHD